MNSYTQLTAIIEDLQANGKTVTITKLPTRKARKGELIMSQTKGSRTNTNRRGQSYNSGATPATRSIIEGDAASYYKTTGWTP